MEPHGHDRTLPSARPAPALVKDARELARPYAGGVSLKRPSDGVLRAFGATEEARPLRGGQGTSWISGTVVFKPGQGPAHRWVGQALGGLRFDAVRLAPPVAASDGAWSVEGWTATRWVEGAEPDLSQPSSWLSVVQAGRAFHRAVRGVRRPEFLDAREDAWAHADRAAWGEQPLRVRPEFANVATRFQRPPAPAGRPQLVHGDLTGNVLLASGLPPAVIDISPYWRPPRYAEAIVAADALCWHGADASVLELLGVGESDVARALLFRMATTSLLAPTTPAVDWVSEAQRYERAADAIGL